MVAVVTQAPESMVAEDDGVDAVIAQCEAVFQENRSVLKVCTARHLLQNCIIPGSLYAPFGPQCIAAYKTGSTKLEKAQGSPPLSSLFSPLSFRNAR